MAVTGSLREGSADAPLPHRRWAAALLPLLLLPPGPGPATAGPASLGAADLQERDQRFHPVPSTGGIVASQERLASEVGAQVLRQGGNAVDAAVATAFALAVTLPQAGNLGGGGFLVLWLPGASPAAARGCPLQRDPELRIGRGTAVAVNFRETAPRAARADLFLRPDGSVDRERATRSLLSVGVPGSVAGLTLAQRCYGRWPLRRVMAPAVALARDGFVVGPVLSRSLAEAAPLLGADPTARRLFLRGGRAPARGERLRQPSWPPRSSASPLPAMPGFYRGPVADALVALMEQGAG